MKTSFPLILIVISLLITKSIFGQSGNNSLAFPDGVYFSFKQLQSGQPGLVTSQLHNAHRKAVSPKQWFRSDSLYCEINDQRVSIPVDSIFAFVDEGQLYIQRKTFAHKVTVPGVLSFFSESYPIQSSPAPVSIDLARDIIPRILDFETGTFRDYNVNEMEEILKERDQDLYNEFNRLETQKLKRQLLLRYIEKYNERHPLKLS